MNEEILNQLKDIHWQVKPAIWPLAFGYYGIFLLVFIMIAICCFFILRRKWHRLRKEIINEFSIIESHFLTSDDIAFLQSSISALLRRMVFLKRPEEFERSCDLEQMKPALFTILPRRNKTEQIIALLNKDRFHKDPDVDAELLLNLVREQIKRCRI